jgi:hypothetical protein
MKLISIQNNKKCRVGCQEIYTPIHFSAGSRKMNRIAGGAEPESPAFGGIARKNHEARLPPWAGRAIQMRNGECGMGEKNEKLFLSQSPQGSQRRPEKE